jgi:Holliday junction resolvase RusA-like endonuclease
MMTFHVLRLKGHYRTGKYAGILRDDAPNYVAVKPDLTKLERSTEDALTGIIFRDDSQVASKDTKKIYVEKYPGVGITINELKG